jgi:hypothetical protein
MFSSYKTALVNAAATEITNSLDDLENKFSPIPEPEDNTWLLLLIDLVTLGASGVAAPFFNSGMFCRTKQTLVRRILICNPLKKFYRRCPISLQRVALYWTTPRILQ